MSVFANVNGENKELYRIFFNDNGVIREIKSFHAQNDNNEIKELFVRDLSIPTGLQWVAYNGDSPDSSTINSVTNNGYTINAHITNKRRSIATKDKIFLTVGTKIRVEFSNTVYDTGEEIITAGNAITLFKTESTTDGVQDMISGSSSNTLTVKDTGDYYIALSAWGHDASGNNYDCTTDVDVTILPPIGLEWIAYNGDNPDSSTINSVTNNGYTISGRFTDKKRSISTYKKVYLPAGTKIRAEISNIIYETSLRMYPRVHIYLFDTDSISDDVQQEWDYGTSTTMTVQTAGDYYIAFSTFARDDNTNVHYFTSDLNITIYPPN